MIFVCDFFVISREVYEKKSVICPSCIVRVLKENCEYYEAAAVNSDMKR